MDIGGLGRTMADSDGHWRTRTNLCCKGRPAFRDRITKGNPRVQNLVRKILIMFVRVCPVLFEFYETTDVFFGSLADIYGH